MGWMHGLKRWHHAFPAMDSNFHRFDVMVAIVIAMLIAAWIIAFAGFWIWAALT